MKWLLILVIASMILLSGCASQPQQSVKCPDGSYVGSIESCSKTNNEPEQTPFEKDIENLEGTLDTLEGDAPNDDLSDSMDDLKDGLEDLKETSEALQLVKDCAKACSGEAADIPAVYNELYLACNEAYYYGGVEVLQEFIEGCKEQ